MIWIIPLDPWIPRRSGAASAAVGAVWCGLGHLRGTLWGEDLSERGLKVEAFPQLIIYYHILSHIYILYI